MKKNKKLNPLLSKKEIAELKYAEKKLLEIQKMLEEKKKEYEKKYEQANIKEDIPIIFKGKDE